jgi:glycosyltransferase 2 family protein
MSYVAVTNAYHIHRHAQMTLSNVLLLTGASVVGGLLQLPVVGGGSQLATIGVLHGVFALSPELSTSCGMMLWLVTFMSVIPAGLFLAHRERVSLVRLEEESEKQIGASGHQGIGASGHQGIGASEGKESSAP